MAKKWSVTIRWGTDPQETASYDFATERELHAFVQYKRASQTPKARELRMRRLAQQKGFLLKKPRKRNTRSCFGTYVLIRDLNVPEAFAGKTFYSTLEAVECDSQQWTKKGA